MIDVFQRMSLCGELTDAPRPLSQPRFRFQGICNGDLKTFNIDIASSEDNRLHWMAVLHQGVKEAEERWSRRRKVKSSKRRSQQASSARSVPDSSDPALICVKDCHSKIGFLVTHKAASPHTVTEVIWLLHHLFRDGWLPQGYY